MLKFGRNKKRWHMGRRPYFEVFCDLLTQLILGNLGSILFIQWKEKKDKQINNYNNDNNNNNNYNLASYCSTTVHGFVLVLIFSKSLKRYVSSLFFLTIFKSHSNFPKGFSRPSLAQSRMTAHSERVSRSDDTRCKQLLKLLVQAFSYRQELFLSRFVRFPCL